MGIGDWLRNLIGGSGPNPVPRIPAGAPARETIERQLASAGVPGAALARIRDGEIDWVAGYGKSSHSRSAHHVSGDTIFQGASLSKPVTALAVMALVQEGKLDLDADVRPLLDYVIPVHPLAGGQANRPITARLLLQHRGGIIGRGTTPDGAGGFLGPDRGGGSLRLRQGRGVRIPTLSESWHGFGRAGAIQVTHPPDSRFSYSGAGYLVLEHLIEKRSGVSYSKYLSGLLASMGAKAASFDLYPPPHLLLARGHDERGHELKGGHELVPWFAAGGLFTSATSMAEVVATLLRGGDEVVDDGLIRSLVGDGLGVFVRTGSKPSFVHGGDNGGYRASITGFPGSLDGAVVLTNGRSNNGVALRHELSSLVLSS